MPNGGEGAPPRDSSGETVRRHLREAIGVHEEVLATCIDDIVRAAQLITDCFRHDGKLLICGNGGSAADAQHVAAEFVNRLSAEFERDALPALALTTDTSFLTSFANDHGYEDVFARQVQAFGRSGDALLCISTSGRSASVLRAAEAARLQGVSTVALVGQGGSLEAAADIAVVVPSRRTAAIQEAMLPIEHSICELVEHALFGPGSQAGKARGWRPASHRRPRTPDASG